MTLREAVPGLSPRVWLVAGAAAIGVAAGWAYLFLRAPTYTASAVIQLERGPSPVRRVEDLSAFLAEEPPSEPEIELLRSRSLAAIVVERAALDVRIRPRTLPLVGAAIARRHAGPGLAPPTLGLDRYAWGGERIRLDRLLVSDDLVGRRIRITSRDDQKISVRGPDGLVAEGRVGETVTARAGKSWLELRVVELVARPGTDFDAWKTRPGDAARELLDRLAVTERGKQSGLLVVGLEWKEKERVAGIVDEIAAAYLRESGIRRSAEAASTLEFLEEQLPLLREQLAEAEALLVAFRRQHTPVGLQGGVDSILARTTAARRELSRVEQERADAEGRYTSSHPAMTALADKVATLHGELAALGSQMRELPAEAVEAVRLSRDVEVGNELYLMMLERVQELQVVKSGASGNARVVDRPSTPDEPASPRPVPVLAVALLLGLVVGRGVAVAWSDLDDRDATPEDVERSTGLAFYGAIPYSARQAALSRRRGRRSAALPVLAAVDPGDVAVEGLRGVAAGIDFALAEARNNVVAVMGPRPGLGKSFVAVNLAAVLASSGRRVLLVDGDLRRGELHRHFAHPRRPGLAELVTAEVPSDVALRGSGLPRLDLLSTGRIPPQPAELLGGERFRRVLSQLAARYDVVVVDTPPVLAATDAAVVAQRAGVLLLVLRSGRSSIREVQTALKQLLQAGVRVNGAVMNELATRDGAAAYR